MNTQGQDDGAVTALHRLQRRRGVRENSSVGETQRGRERAGLFALDLRKLK